MDFSDLFLDGDYYRPRLYHCFHMPVVQRIHYYEKLALPQALCPSCHSMVFNHQDLVRIRDDLALYMQQRKLYIVALNVVDR